MSVVLLALLAGCASSAGSGSGPSTEDVTGEWVESWL